MTVGLGADALAATSQPDLAKAVQLPRFPGDAALPARRLGGALLISVNGSDPTVLEPVLSRLVGTLTGYRLRWSDYGYRGPADQGVTRNPFGYFDGIIVPRTPADQDADVWIGDGPLAGGTICVVRRFRLNTEHFRALEPAAQDRVIGRHRQDGSPLSGGGRFDQIDLDAKTDTGDLMVPARAHARAAHPSFTGSRLMLRRSYNYRATADDHGHLFISYQNDVGAFAKTATAAGRGRRSDELRHPDSDCGVRGAAGHRRRRWCRPAAGQHIVLTGQSVNRALPNQSPAAERPGGIAQTPPPMCAMYSLSRSNWPSRDCSTLNWACGSFW